MRQLLGSFVVVVAVATVTGCAGVTTRAPAETAAVGAASQALTAKRHDPYALLVVTEEDAAKVGTTTISNAAVFEAPRPAAPTGGLLAMPMKRADARSVVGAESIEEPSVQTWGVPFELDLSELPDTRE